MDASTTAARRVEPPRHRTCLPRPRRVLYLLWPHPTPGVLPPSSPLVSSSLPQYPTFMHCLSRSSTPVALGFLLRRPFSHTPQPWPCPLGTDTSIATHGMAPPSPRAAHRHGRLLVYHNHAHTDRCKPSLRSVLPLGDRRRNGALIHKHTHGTARQRPGPCLADVPNTREPTSPRTFKPRGAQAIARATQLPPLATHMVSDPAHTQSRLFSMSSLLSFGVGTCTITACTLAFEHSNATS